MKKSIGIISKASSIANFYKDILSQVFTDNIDIYTYSIEEKTIKLLHNCDLYLLSATSDDIKKYKWAEDFLPPESKTVKADIVFSKKAIDILKKYPVGTKALIVNQNKHMTMESLSQLTHLGISNIEFFLYYPKMKKVPSVDLAFATGEKELIPSKISNCIDLGCRKLSVNTIYEIALKLDLTFVLKEKEFENYINSLAVKNYSLQKISYNNLTTELKLEAILNSLDSGVIIMDEQNNITMINDVAKNLLQLKFNILGKSIKEVFPWLSITPLPIFTNENSKLIKIENNEISVSIMPLLLKNKFLGNFALLEKFDLSEKKQNALRIQKIKKKSYAKFTFEDIIGTSSAIQSVKDIAIRMAANNCSIILEGDSGAGKEMFAQAIHNASPRRDSAFVAINCAALPETLLESELFGYTEGSFTGAKKGGKIGLFEFANGGTLFLDEIESMSPMMQVKLLRVLQEKEIVKIGATEPIGIDVRIISSTNENILEKISQSKFRKDLYYRLNVIPIRIPSLKERKEDIFSLIKYFQNELNTNFELTDTVKSIFLNYPWLGNVRELRNLIEYFSCLDISKIDYIHLPEPFQNSLIQNHIKVNFKKSSVNNSSHLKFLPQEVAVLQVLENRYSYGKGFGRNGIIKACEDMGCLITEHEVREILKKFQKEKYVRVNKGRSGTYLTEKGNNIIKKLKNLS
ncbi:sigma-54 interaction domain-containing protein [Fusobacterium sp.]|uniref:sigma-54 interaction domain-containing protein n=1 Tax=Fusobacterium sp. TaxID=68766 RepID=UPI002901A0C2|nr:sigma 54-interacting transcriptional regulator [Fusobacterium sp.]MDU1909781.1 sigma 54-interacting transcriptional regulator [Fusobacterium sp.]